MRTARHARRRAERDRPPVDVARRARTAEPPDAGHDHRGGAADAGYDHRGGAADAGYDHRGGAADAGLPAVRELP